MNTQEEITLESLEEKYGNNLPSMVGVNGNAFALMAHFKNHARRHGWESEDIDFVLEKAKSGDYDNLVQTIVRFTE